MIITTKETWSELLHNAGVYDALQVTEDEDFLVEVALLNFWNQEIEDETGFSGYQLLEANVQPIDQLSGVKLDILHETGEVLQFVYIPCDNRRALTIVRDDQIIYARMHFDNPRTDWAINCMADDPTVTGEDGEPLFQGDHTNI